MGHRIRRLWPALVAGSALAAFACSHPGGSSHPSGGAGTTGSGGNVSPAGSAGTGGDTGTPGTAGAIGTAGDSGAAGNVGTGSAGNVGTTGAAGDGGPGAAGTTGAAGNGTGSAGNVGTTGAAGNGSAGDVGPTGGGGAGGTGAGTNLITNGDLSSGATNWHTEMGTGNVNNGAYCVTNPGAALVGWSSTAGMPLILSGGTSYRLSFQASGMGTVHTKVGLAVSPYTADFEGNDNVGSSLQTFTHTFMPTSTDSNAGIAFTFMNAGTSTVCIDNVTLVAD
jgi:hypothetical protein